MFKFGLNFSALVMYSWKAETAQCKLFMAKFQTSQVVGELSWNNSTRPSRISPIFAVVIQLHLILDIHKSLKVYCIKPSSCQKLRGVGKSTKNNKFRQYWNAFHSNIFKSVSCTTTKSVTCPCIIIISFHSLRQLPNNTSRSWENRSTSLVGICSVSLRFSLAHFTNYHFYHYYQLVSSCVRK